MQVEIKVLDSATQGTVKVQVEYKDITGESTIIVTGTPKIKGIVMTPAEDTVSLGKTVQLSVRGILTDESTKDVTDGLSGTAYTLSDTKKATIDSNGLVTISNNATNGYIKVKAINNGATTQSIITINGVPTMKGIEIAPINGDIFQNTSHQLIIQSRY